MNHFIVLFLFLLPSWIFFCFLLVIKFLEKRNQTVAIYSNLIITIAISLIVVGFNLYFENYFGAVFFLILSIGINYLIYNKIKSSPDRIDKSTSK